MSEKYNIIRFYRENFFGKVDVIKTGVSLEEAQTWCRNPETSSSTCTTPEGLARTKQFGDWFDGYEQQKNTNHKGPVQSLLETIQKCVGPLEEMGK